MCSNNSNNDVRLVPTEDKMGADQHTQMLS
jgi:hypothetical protein